jgi:hypothetical protein
LNEFHVLALWRIKHHIFYHLVNFSFGWNGLVRRGVCLLLLFRSLLDLKD